MTEVAAIDNENPQQILDLQDDEAQSVAHSPPRLSEEAQPNQVLPSQEKEEPYQEHAEIKIEGSVPAKPKLEKTLEHDIEQVNQQAEVISLIWDRDSHGLFDYESRQLEESRITQAGCGQVVRDKYQLKSVMPFSAEEDNEESETEKQQQKLLSLVYKQGLYWVYHFKSMFSKEKPDQLCSAQEFAHTDQVWQVVRLQNIPYERFMLTESSLQMQDRNKKWKSPENLVTIVKGDIVKFGRVRFRVRELVIESQQSVSAPGNQKLAGISHLRKESTGSNGPAREPTNQSMAMDRRHTSVVTDMQTLNLNQSIGDDQAANFSFEPGNPLAKNQEEEKVASCNPEAMKVQSEQNICRICLSEEELPDHQLLTPCLCSGGMGYIGVSCLQEWLEGKKHKKEMPYVNSYIWKGLECEICKSPFKDTYLMPDGFTQGDLLNFKRYKGCNNYMVIESVTNTTSKTIHVINFDVVPDVRVGRAQYVEVRITDISVSRYHACLTLQKDLGIVTVEDNFSKFGTLKLLQQPLAVGQASQAAAFADRMTIPVQESLYLQCGRAVIGIRSLSYKTGVMARLTKACCCLRPKNNKKPGDGQTQNENLLHYLEAVKHFPWEYLEFYANLQVIENSVLVSNGYDANMYYTAAKGHKKLADDELVAPNNQTAEHGCSNIVEDDQDGNEIGINLHSNDENELPIELLDPVQEHPLVESSQFEDEGEEGEESEEEGSYYDESHAEMAQMAGEQPLDENADNQEEEEEERKSEFAVSPRIRDLGVGGQNRSRTMMGVGGADHHININQSTGTMNLNGSHGNVPTIGAFESRQSAYPQPSGLGGAGMKPNQRFQTVNAELQPGNVSGDELAGPAFNVAAEASQPSLTNAYNDSMLKLGGQSLIVDDDHQISPMHADTKETAGLNLAQARPDNHETIKMATLDGSHIKVQPSNQNFRTQNKSTTHNTIQEQIETQERS